MRNASLNPDKSFGFSRVFALFALVFTLLSLPLFSSAALADLRLCNQTGSRVGAAVAYQDGQIWVSEGWFNLKPNSCESVLKGKLSARYFYITATDYDRGGEWSGQYYLCTTEKEFSIRGAVDCYARGLDRTAFFEIDTAQQGEWTVELTENARTESEKK